jgi:hypothetical protein
MIEKKSKSPNSARPVGTIMLFERTTLCRRSGSSPAEIHPLRLLGQADDHARNFK